MKCKDKVMIKKSATPCEEAPKACCKRRGRPAMSSATFTFHGEKGLDVYVAGEFNGWDPTAKKLAYKARQGIYTATIKVAPGTYQYKFVVGGTWCADPLNAESVQNDQGTFNSVIIVK